MVLPRGATAPEITHVHKFNPYAANGRFGKYKMMHKTCKMTETLEHGYSSESTQRELSNEYQHDRIEMVFKKFGILVQSA